MSIIVSLHSFVLIVTFNDKESTFNGEYYLQCLIRVRLEVKISIRAWVLG